MEFLNNIALAPVDVTIDGIVEPVTIHRFSWEYWDANIAPKIQDEDLAVAVLYFLNPVGYQHEAGHREKIRQKIGVPQILDIYREGLRLNGCAVASGQDAKKN